MTGIATGLGIGTDRLISIENFNTAAGNDNLTGDNNANRFITRGGTDTIDARGGDDNISTGADADVVNAGAGNDTVDAGPVITPWTVERR
jgi:Ca2+-binding RTX toxin-like protein